MFIFLGIVQVVLGGLSMILGVVSIFVSNYNVFALIAPGIWGGLFILLAGVFCMCAARQHAGNGMKCTAVTFCILATLAACAAFGMSITAAL